MRLIATLLFTFLLCVTLFPYRVYAATQVGSVTSSTYPYRLPDGTLLIAYEQSHILYFAIRTDNGASWDIPVGAQITVPSSWSVDVDDLGDIHVVYEVDTAKRVRYAVGTLSPDKTFITWRVSNYLTYNGENIPMGEERRLFVFTDQNTGVRHARVVAHEYIGLNPWGDHIVVTPITVTATSITNGAPTTVTTRAYRYGVYMAKGPGHFAVAWEYDWIDYGVDLTVRTFAVTSGTTSTTELLRYDEEFRGVIHFWATPGGRYEILYSEDEAHPNQYVLRSRAPDGKWSYLPLPSDYINNDVKQGRYGSVTVEPETDDVYILVWRPGADPNRRDLVMHVYDRDRASWSTQQVCTACLGLGGVDVRPVADWGHIDYVFTYNNVRYYDYYLLDRPPAATILGPRDSQWVSTLTPTLSWQFSDPDAGDYQTYYRVRVLSGSNVLWDSGKVKSSATSRAVPAGVLSDSPTPYTWELQVWDKYNVPSTIVSTTFRVDASPPTASITLASGATYTTSTSVQASISATDPTSGVVEMRLSTDGGSTWTAWQPYTSTTWVTLPSGDGNKTVHLQVRNGAGLVSAAASDSIILDTTPPTGSVIISGGAPYTRDRAVTLTLSATDATSGVDSMRISPDGGVTWTNWQAYATTAQVTLPEGDGTKQVLVQFRDGAGLVTQVQDTIVLDTTPPKGSVLLNDGEETTYHTTLTLSIDAVDATSCLASLRTSADGIAWSDWIPFTPRLTWKAPPGWGTKTVYVQLQDQAGNISDVLSDSIWVALDATGPALTVLIDGGAPTTSDPNVVLTIRSADNADEPSQLQIRVSNDGSTWTPWQPYTPTMPWTLSPGDGLKVVYVQARDQSGNVSLAQAHILLETGTGATTLSAVPSATTAVLDGRTVYAVSDPALSLRLDSPGATHYRIRIGEDPWGEWQPFRSQTTVSLSPVEGLHQVQVQTRTADGGVSAAATIHVVYDRTPPELSAKWANDVTATTSGKVTVVLRSADNLFPESSLAFAYSIDGGKTWTTLPGSTATISVSGEAGKREVLFRVTDPAGNSRIVALTIWVL